MINAQTILRAALCQLARGIARACRWRHGCAVLALLTLTGAVRDAEAAFPNGYNYRRLIDITNAQVSSGPHTNFPVLISTTLADLRTTGNGGKVTDAQGDDIIFTASDGTTQLAHEVERYVATTGELVAWVRVPSLASTSTLYIYYGNPAVTTFQGNVTSNGVTGVWDANFKMVHHLKETSGAHLDSTSNGKDSTAVSVSAQGSAAGKINGADSFTGASGHNIDIGDASNDLGMSSTDSITVEAWVRTSTTGSFQFVVNKKTGSSDWQLHINDTNMPDFWLWDGTNQARAYGSVTVTDNAWHYLVARWDDSISEARIFVDGVSSGSGTNSSFTGVSNTNPVVIGEEGDANRGFNFTGTMDEVRISKTARSNGWILTSYNNQNSPAGFYSMGAEQSTATLSSASSQTFTVGQAAATASTLTVTDSATPTITAAQDLRIRIPSGFNMTWDTTVTSFTAGGGAAGKVSATGVTFEDSNRTAVINVTSNFAASDVLTIAGLRFANFTAVSAASNLQLVVAGSGGATAATDDKTIAITSPSVGFRGAGAVASACGANTGITPGLPSGWQPNDIHIAIIESGTDIAVTMPAGWNLIDAAQHDCCSDEFRATLFWRRAQAGDTDPAISHPGGYQTIIARIIGFSNVDTVTALDTTPSFTASPLDNDVNAGAITTVTANTTLVFTAHIADDQSSLGAPGAPTGSSPWTQAFYSDVACAGDIDLGIAAWYGQRSATGNQPAVASAWTGSTKTSVGAQIALRPITGGGGAPPTLSSASNQTFLVGQAAATASTLTVTDSATPTITAAQDLRIRIPSGFNMTWDTTVTSFTAGGGAAGKVSATGVTFEDSNRTAVINVTSNFAASDVLTIAGLRFANFTAVSAASNLQLVVAGSGGATAATNDKTIAIIAPSCDGAIAFDNSSSGTANSSVSSLTWSHTTGAGTNRILLVSVAWRENGSTTSSVTYNNISLSQVGSMTTSDGFVIVELWQLVAPPAGTFDVVVTRSGSARMGTGALTLTGVDQTTPIEASNTATGQNNTTPSVSVTTVSNNAWVVDALAFRREGAGAGDVPTGTPGAGQTERWSAYVESGGTTSDIRNKGSTEGPKTPAGAVTMSWTLSNAADWAQIAVSLKPAGGLLSLSSAANQTFTVGQSSTTASTLTVTECAAPTITAAQDLRIRIPAGFNMTWDPTVTSFTAGGSASGKVSATGVTFEDSNRTAVINVTSNFAADDMLTIAGLNFTNFTGVSAASNLQLVAAGSGGATAATDDKTILVQAPIGATLSSAANQAFIVGQPSTAAVRMTVTDGSTPSITAAQEIRIRIPVALNMTWDPAVTAVTLGGGAAGKVSATLLAYENSNKTAVLNVSTNFAANDQLTIEGLKFTSFTAVSAASNLQLVVTGAGGATAATDDKSIQIVSVVRLSSAANQAFNVGQASTTASNLTVTESSTPTITAAQDIRIRIPAALGVIWDSSVTSVTRTGTASGKVSATVSYEDSNKTVRINVTSDFAGGDVLTIAGLKFTSFTAISASNLQLVVTGSGGVTAAIDDKTITISGQLGVGTGTTVAGCVAPGSGAITFDAASVQAGSSSGSTSLTWSHTVTSAGSDRILIVGVGVDQDQTCCRTVTGVTYGGVSMTVVPGGISTNANATRAELWYLVNPPTGANNVVVTLSGTADVRAGATSYTGVNQATPLGTAIGATGSSSTASVSGVSSAAGELVVDHASMETTSSYFDAPGAGQTSRYTSHGTDGGGSSNNVPIAGSSEPGAATVTMSWSMEASKDWAIVAVPLKPGAATMTSLTLPSWTPQPNELLLVGLALRDETIVPSVSGHGLTWTQVADRDNDRGEMGVNLYRASGASPSAGSIVISLPGNTLPAYAIAVRMSNVDTAVNQGVEAVATASGPAVTDNANMKVSVTTLTANATALAWGGQRGSATLSLPGGETVVAQSSADCGTSGDRIRGHMWQEVVPSPGATQLGQDNSLSTAVPWAAIGVSIKPLPPTPPQPPGRFNAFEPTTVAGALTGVIRTKLAGDTVSLDVIALNSTRTAVDSAFTGQVRVEVLNASNNTGGFDGNGCRSSWTVIQTLSHPTFSAGDNGRKAVSFTLPNSYSDVRLRISYPTSSPSQIGCSNDNFAVRPATLANFALSDATWQTAGTNRALNDMTFTVPPTGKVHKAGRPLSARASAVNSSGTTVTSNYAGAPAKWLSACAGAACTPDFGTLTLTSTFASGQLSTDVASYDDVGSFALQLVDSTYASVDVNDTVGDCTASGSYTCSATIDVGRFVPDHFAVALNTPSFGSACGSFTYLGQTFAYSTAPVITLTARNFAGATTTRYADPAKWWRITNASLTGKAYTTASGTLDASGVPGTDPVINSSAGSGTGALNFSSGTGLFFPRTTPVAPFDAEVSLAINVIDADGVAYASNPARFGQATAGNGIAFNTGKPMRFGRYTIRNAYGSQLLPLLVRVEAQYWSGPPANTFVTNTLDSCTNVSSANFAMDPYTGNLSGSPSCETAIGNGGTLSAGRRTVVLAAPGAGNDGSVNLTVNLGASASGSTCTTLGAAPGSATAPNPNLSHLQGNWAGGAYNVNPSARATFGVYRGSEDVIHVRENY